MPGRCMIWHGRSVLTNNVRLGGKRDMAQFKVGEDLAFCGDEKDFPGVKRIAEKVKEDA